MVWGASCLARRVRYAAQLACVMGAVKIDTILGEQEKKKKYDAAKLESQAGQTQAMVKVAHSLSLLRNCRFLQDSKEIYRPLARLSTLRSGPHYFGLQHSDCNLVL